MEMQIFEINNPTIGANVIYKVLPTEDAQQFVTKYINLDRTQFMRKVIENMIYNLRPDITLLLRSMPTERANLALKTLYNGAIMLNPSLDVDDWNELAVSGRPNDYNEYTDFPRALPAGQPKPQESRSPLRRLTGARLNYIEKRLKSIVIGQDEAIDEIVIMLKRNAAGLGDKDRPLGVFLFAGPSGSGKTYLAKELHEALFGKKTSPIRFDCGEYQHKHENQKLIGSPVGYVGSDDGGQLTNALMEQPDTVLLLDEAEKAHPDLWHTFLRAFDEGIIVDNKGRKVSLANTIIIMTSNSGNRIITERMVGNEIGFSRDKVISTNSKNAKVLARQEIQRHTLDAIQKQFNPEFINRLDKIVVFNTLSVENIKEIAKLEMIVIQNKLGRKGFNYFYDEATLEMLALAGMHPIQGARALAKIRKDAIEPKIAEILLSKRLPRGTTFQVGVKEDEYFVKIKLPTPRILQIESANPL